MRKVVSLLVVSLLFGFAAAAQDKADAFVGYSYTRQNYGNGFNPINLNGGIGQVVFYPTRWFGVVGEVGGQFTGSVSTVLPPVITPTSTSGVMYTFMGGPRLAFRHGPFQPYVQGLFGASHLDSNLQTALGASSSNGFAMALGGGVDLKLARHFAVRLGQLDYLLTQLNSPTNVRFTQNNFRYSAGFVFRF